jgi:hypothetical protein
VQQLTAIAAVNNKQQPLVFDGRCCHCVAAAMVVVNGGDSGH